MLDLYMEMTLINIHAVNVEKRIHLAYFPLFYLTPYLNKIVLHPKV